MEQEKKYFADQSGRGNFDDASFVIGLNEWVNAENCRTGSTDAGVIGTVESIGSTLLLSQPQPSVTFIEIGTVADDENGRIITFLYNTLNSQHKIICNYPTLGTEYTVLLSSQVTGGLNFNKNFPIHSARIVDNKLYWVEDTNNQPRKINIESGILLNHPSFISDEEPYVSPLDFSEITIIKPPPAYAPNIIKAQDTGFTNNFIYNLSFQFAFQFVYYDNETTTIGTYSAGSRLSVPTDTYNYISVVMDGSQTIPGTVRMVNLIVRIGNTNSATVVKTWDKEVPDEAQEIENQNNLSDPLTFNFYNNITGGTIAPEDVLKQYDNVPLYAKALETAKNRLFLGNITSGYDAPGETSLEVSASISGISGVTSNVKPVLQVRVKVGVPGPDNDYMYAGWYVQMNATDGVTPGYYLINGTDITAPSESYSLTVPTLSAPPASTSIAGLTFKGVTQRDVTDAASVGVNPAYTNEAGAFYSSSYTIAITGITSTTDSVFKSRSTYKLGVVFYDFAMRRCGVVTNDSLVQSIATRNFAYSTATKALVWTLSNVDAVNEIPDWAYYYTVVRTLNLTTRFFVDAFTEDAKYATKDADGNYEFTNDTYIPSVVGIGLNTTSLFQAGLGYSFTQGDVAVIIDNANNVYELPVVAQSGEYIVVKAQDIGDLSTLSLIYEIYTPYQTSEQEPFFETGFMYAVTNPGESNREYSVTTDVLAPDTYTIQRNFDADTYVAEAMSPNDLFYSTWYNDDGKPNLITKLGQVSKINFITWSATFIPGTAINGLSTFDALSQTNIPEDCGAIQKLILTSKVQGEGTIMLAIGTVETCSLYLQETQITDSTGATQFFSAASSVIGTINILQGSFGTVNPESVILYRGLVFWFDAANGRIIQYSANGLFPISNYKMTRFWKQFSIQYLSMTSEQIEALGSRPFIFMTVDPAHDELLISIPKLLSVPPKGYLPDYPEIVYPFDIWDGQSKCIVYHLAAQPNFWGGSYPYTAEGFITLQNRLFLYKNGLLYEGNQTDSQCNIFGVQHKPRIMCVGNMFPQIPKVYDNLVVEANMKPTFVYLYNDYPNQQSSDLTDISFRDKEGVFYAPILRNKLIPTATGYDTDGLLTGEKMRNVAMFIMLEFTVTTTPLELKFLYINFKISKGHKVQ